jgi:EAL domain-containing protein (putative c-di-GMP-specific phosphodiesterase class I)
MGVAIALDDFGTGYSSLSYLKKFPINTLKIDRSFIITIDSDSEDAAIVQAIIALANTLKLNVVAEGVETHGQLQTLNRFQCDIIQGYYFSKPVPADQIIKLTQQPLTKALA